MYYIGIDGSGSFSRIVGTDTQLRIIGRHTGNQVNLAQNSYETVRNNMRALIEEFGKLTNTWISDCRGLCIGSAGIGSKESCDKMEEIFREMGFSCPVSVVNEAELVLAAETLGKPGIAIISGTASIAIAIDKEGQLHRAGGNGYMLDDGGSGYWIGLQAIRYALMSQDGRFPETMLTKSVLAHYKTDKLSDVVDSFYNGAFKRSFVTELNLFVKYAADQNDAAALLIEENAANELLKLADSLLKKCGLSDTTVVLSGSVLLINDRIRDRLISLLRDKYNKLIITSTKGKPEMGAVYIAVASAR